MEISGKKLIHLFRDEVERSFQGEISRVEYSKRICQSHCGLTDSLLSVQGPHPLTDRPSDLVRRVFLNEMHALDLNLGLRWP